MFRNNGMPLPYYELNSTSSLGTANHNLLSSGQGLFQGKVENVWIDFNYYMWHKLKCTDSGYLFSFYSIIYYEVIQPKNYAKKKRVDCKIQCSCLGKIS